MPEFKRVCSPAKRPPAKLEPIFLLKYVYKDLERCDKRKNSSETLNNALLLIELIKDIVPMLNCDKGTKYFVPSLLVMVLSSWSLAGEPLVQRIRSATISDLRQACMTINMPAAKQFLEHTDFREWKNSTGEFSINARMLHADTKNVSLEESASKRDSNASRNVYANDLFF